MIGASQPYSLFSSTRMRELLLNRKCHRNGAKLTNHDVEFFRSDKMSYVTVGASSDGLQGVCTWVDSVSRLE